MNKPDPTEQRRLRALARYQIIDTAPEPVFDDLARLAATVCQSPMAIVSLIDESRQWFKASVGIDLDETDRTVALCNHAIRGSDVLIVEDTQRDQRFVDNPLVTDKPHIRFYAGAPLRDPEGNAIGTIAVFDNRPRKLDDTQTESLEALAKLAVDQLEMRLSQINLEGALHDQEAAAREFHASQERFHRALENIPDVVVLYDADLRIRYINPATTKITGMQPEEFVGKRDADLFSPDKHKPVLDLLHAALETGQEQKISTELKLPNVGTRYLEIRALPVFDKQGRIQEILGITHDQTEHIRYERQLEESRKLLEIAGRAARFGGWRVDVASGQITWSDEVAAIHEEPPGTSPGLDEGISYYAPEHQDQIRQAYQHCVQKGVPFDEELQIITAGGNRVWVRSIGEPVFDDEHNVFAVQGAFQNISEQKAAEEETRNLARRLSHTLASITDAVFTLDREWRFTYLNPEAERVLLRTADDLCGKNVWEEFPGAEDALFGEMYPYAMEHRKPVVFEEYYPMLESWFHVRAYPSEEGLVVYFHDVTEHRESQKQLHLLETAVSRLNDIVLITEADPIAEPGPRIVYVNDAFERITGFSREEAIGRTPRMLQGPETSRYELDRIRAALEKRDPVRAELVNYGRDGGKYWLEIEIVPITDRHGNVTHLASVQRDITTRVELEEQLRQSQRLESLGQLTGGIAHDFNNLLTVILGNTELLSEHLESSPELRQLAVTSQSAAERGANLTNRLLTFARRQTLEPRPTDIKALIGHMVPLLQRTLGDDIELRITHAPDLWMSRIDPAQLESTVLNLAINARDAMPDGGRLTIETANVELDSEHVKAHSDVEPGQYVHIKVTDTGTGIEPDNLSRLFEPFFTTKIQSKGTGLGLPMVYGFIKQSRGHITVDSTPGHGASFHVYLPYTRSQDAGSQPEPPRDAGRGGREHILLVEDDELVRGYARRALSSLGYEVTATHDGTSAMELMKEGNQFDLLFTDVVMPGGMSGPELARQARRLQSGLKVLYTSGYTSDPVNEGSDVHLLHKPYLRKQLAEKIRQALDDS